MYNATHPCYRWKRDIAWAEPGYLYRDSPAAHAHTHDHAGAGVPGKDRWPGVAAHCRHARR